MGLSLILRLLWMQSTSDQFVSQHDDAIPEAKNRIHGPMITFWANYEKILACSKGERKQAQKRGQCLKQLLFVFNSLTTITRFQ